LQHNLAGAGRNTPGARGVAIAIFATYTSCLASIGCQILSHEDRKVVHFQAITAGFWLLQPSENKGIGASGHSRGAAPILDYVIIPQQTGTFGS